MNRHAPNSPRSIGFCVTRDCISSSSGSFHLSREFESSELIILEVASDTIYLAVGSAIHGREADGGLAYELLWELRHHIRGEPVRNRLHIVRWVAGARSKCVCWRVLASCKW